MVNKTTIKTGKNGQQDYHQDRQKCPIRLPSGPTKMANKRLPSEPTKMANETAIKTDKNGQ